MAAPFDPARATAEERAAIIEHGASWRARMRSTERADRPATEAAIRELYGRARLRQPSIEWRDSPVAAGAAARYSGRAGETGDGLARAFRVDPRWVRSTMAMLGDTPDYVHFRQAPRQPFRRLLGLREASAGIARPLHGRILQPLADWPATDRIPDPRDVDAAGRVAFGEGWPQIRAVLGREQAWRVLREALRTHVQAASRSAIGLVELTMGQLDSFHPYLSAARDVLERRLAPHHLAHLDAFLAIARSAGPWYALPGVAFVSDRPLRCRVDPEGRLHADDGPALAYGDGVEIYAWHGVRVPAPVVLQPESIELEDILAQQNAEVRRVLAERFGIERFVRAPGSTLMHEDETGRLWRRWITPPRRWGGGGEAIQMVEVLNSTPEPDGTRKTYFLRVPPTIGTARAAVAWTFNLAPAEYRPAVET